MTAWLLHVHVHVVLQSARIISAPWLYLLVRGGCCIMMEQTSESDVSDTDTEVQAPPPKARKLDGAAKYPTKFNPDWSRRWPCIQRQHASNYKFRCTICQCSVTCQHQGEKDVRRHLEGKKHRDNVQALENQPAISALLRPTTHPIHQKVSRAEVKVSTVLAHHNVPIAVADHLSPLFRDIFPDSDIAKAYSCARTKMTCILNGALAGYFRSTLVAYMKIEAFSLATDGSNDSGLQKMNPLTVRIFDVNRVKVSTQLLDMCLTSSSTAESIFTKINDVLRNFEVDWKMCVAFSVDNTSVNLGRRNSIRTRALQQNPSTYFIGCPCHMVHNTATKAAEAFQAATGCDVEDILVDLYYWFDNSTKRKNELSSFCFFCDTQYREVIKHVSTRWLSLEHAVERTLQQYQALTSYFLSSDENQARFQRLKSGFSNPITEVYLLFYQAIIPTFTTLNKFLQRETPCIHLLNDKLQSFFFNLLSKFVKVSIIRDAKEKGELFDVDFSIDNQLQDGKIFIGIMTRQILRKLLNEGDIAEYEVSKFYSGVRDFYTTAIQYIKDTYPLSDPFLQHAKLVNFQDREEICFDSVEYFISRFPHLSALNTPRETELLQEEFVHYQLLSDSEIPTQVWEEAKVNEDEHVYYRIDALWGYICKMQSIGSSQLKFPRLALVAKTVIVVSHSNATEERVFSMIHKNKTPFRPSLALDGTLSSIITVKLAIEEPCEQFEPTKALLDKSKKVSWEYNKAHSSKSK